MDSRSGRSNKVNSHVLQQKTYLSFGTDLAHMNVQLEWEIFFYQWTVWA